MASVIPSEPGPSAPPPSSAPLPSVLISSFQNFIKEYCASTVEEIADADEDNKHYPVRIELLLLERFSGDAFDQLLHEPEKTFPLIETALRNVQRLYTDEPKRNVHARVTYHTRNIKKSVSAIRSRDLGKLISILGTVTRSGAVMLREASREFFCRKCRHTFEVQSDVTLRGSFDMPPKCPSQGDKPCNGTAFNAVDDGGVPNCREYQEVKLQEKVQHLDVGSIPRSIIVVLTDDMCDTVKPGDDVLVSGVLHRRWNRPPAVDRRAEVDLMLVAVDVDNTNETKSYLHVTEESIRVFRDHWGSHPARAKLRARNAILKSICPQIYGMYLLKLIVAMTLIGGVPYTDKNGKRVRGESHLLMVGDPGTAKSQFLRYAAKVTPRSVLTTGIGTTSAGLTVTAVREAGSGEWMLDAGALVLADGGVCCIDEFDGIKKNDRGSIHEAMEQQTVSVAKAGMVCTLDTRATVIAAVNPKSGRIATEVGKSTTGEEGTAAEDTDFHADIPITVGIASPLLSRFDVILTLLDNHNEEWDYQLSSFILNGHKHGGDNGGDNGCATSEEVWSHERLLQYFFYIKTHFKPTLSEQASLILTTYYRKERSSQQRNTARTTVRLLEALVRLAQAHARLMFRDKATPMDAVFAVAAVEASSASLEIVGGMGALHAPFPAEPDAEFENYARHILVQLGLENRGIMFFCDDEEDATPSPPD